MRSRGGLDRLAASSSTRRDPCRLRVGIRLACFREGSQRRRIKVGAILEGETMRFTWPDSKALIFKSGKKLITSFVAAAVVAAVGFAIGSATLASAQDLSPMSQPVAGQAPFDQPDIPISSHDRVYTADQYSNT